MKNQRQQKLTAIKGLLFGALLSCGAAWAAPLAGTIVHLSGPLLVKKADGAIKVLALNSQVESGDTLVSEKNTYAQVRFVDGGEITLQPGTTFRIEQFAFEADKPEADVAAFNLLAGGVRSVTGQLGKRSHDKFALTTPAGTIGVRGTTFHAQLAPPPPGMPVRTDYGPLAQAQQEAARQAGKSAIDRSPGGNGLGNAVQPSGGKQPPQGSVGNPGLLLPVGGGGPPPGAGAPAGSNPALLAPAGNTPTPQALPPGLYVHVIDGAISLDNSAGSQAFQAGQFGFTPSFNQPPVVVPNNPGIQFSPPPVFNGGTGTSPGAPPGGGQAYSCEVR